MAANVFSVELVPVFCASAAEPVKSAFISESSLGTINEIYSAMNRKFLTTLHSGRMAERIKDSFLCCCFSDGMVQLLFKPDDMRLLMWGIFVPLRYLKTAWRVFRRELVYICAAGNTLRTEKVTLGAEEMYALAEKARNEAGPELLERLGAIADGISGEGTPFSFAKTGLPTDILPVYFETRAAGSTAGADADEQGMMILNSNSVRDMSLMMKNRVPAAAELYLCETTGKKYTALKKEELKLELGKSEFKSESKALDTKPELQRDRLWYFRVNDRNGLPHTEPLEQPFQNELCKSETEFHILPSAALNAQSLAAKASIGEGDAKPSDDGTKKRSGLSGLFGHKKK